MQRLLWIGINDLFRGLRTGHPPYVALGAFIVGAVLINRRYQRKLARGITVRTATPGEFKRIIAAERQNSGVLVAVEQMDVPDSS